jgi:hypothetical protein
MSTTKATVFLEFKFLWRCPFVLGGRIISLLALGTGKRNNISHYCIPLLID